MAVDKSMDIGTWRLVLANIFIDEVYTEFLNHIADHWIRYFVL